MTSKKPSIGLLIIKFLVILYDVITYPIYYLIENPSEVLERANKVRARREKSDDLYSPWVRVGLPPKHYLLECKTIPEAQQKSLQLNGRHRPSLGFRKILAEEEEKQPNGKTLKKWKLSEYQWLTIGEVDEKIEFIARGLLSYGVKPKDNVLIFAETRLGMNSDSFELLL
jgi:long-chain acyl-CoA synthetase